MLRAVQTKQSGLSKKANKMKVLVIDDDLLVRTALARLLARHGYEVVTAEDGERGFASVAKEAPAVVITDLIMPRQEGIETIHRLKQEHPEIPIIAMSGGGRFCDLDMLPMAKLMGADATIAKPFESDELLSLLQRLCGSLLRPEPERCRNENPARFPERG
jgi:DNA-binding NtrC family response regulator